MARFGGWLMLAALVAAAVVAALAPGAARGGDQQWTERDFRLRTITSDLGDPSSSFIEFAGTLTPQAHETLYPIVRFTLTADVTCALAADPSQTVTRATAIDSKYSNGFVVYPSGDSPLGTQYTHVDSGTIRWSLRLTFAAPVVNDFNSYYWCGGSGLVLRDLVLTRAQGIAWLSILWFSPPPGTSIYSYDIGPGATEQHFNPDDGVPNY
jgi:hypothetical protein